MDPVWLGVPGLIMWSSVLLLPWRPWSTREFLDADEKPGPGTDLRNVTALIPARNEADVIALTVAALADQGVGLKILVVDDQSTDGTVAEATAARGTADLSVLAGEPLAPGWTGKLWALEQGRRRVETEYILLLDADIELVPGTIAALLGKLRDGGYGLVSLMAHLRMEGFWERLLMPSFIYFFKLLYPFSVSNSESRFVAAAAGGCILMRNDILNDLGGFESIRTALIDDCALARAVKGLGCRTWTGLTHSAISHRRYPDLADVWQMVARTAYTQLRRSGWLLLLCTALMLSAFVLPVAALAQDGPAAPLVGAGGLVFMMASYLPVLRFYHLNPAWAISLPLSGVLYLLMTWTSALRYWFGSGAVWKSRSYSGT